MTEVKRCSLCNTSWPEGELNSHGLCKYCRGEEEITNEDKLYLESEERARKLESLDKQLFQLKKKAEQDQLELFNDKEFV